MRLTSNEPTYTAGWGHLRDMGNNATTEGLWTVLENPGSGGTTPTYIYIDAGRYRPSSGHQRILDTLPPEMLLASPLVLYVSKLDSSRLTLYALADSLPLFVTGASDLPRPQWKCERECYEELDVDGAGLPLTVPGQQFKTATVQWLGKALSFQNTFLSDNL